MKIIVVNDDSRKQVDVKDIKRIDILSILKLKPTNLEIEGFYLSEVDYNTIIHCQELTHYAIRNCYIEGKDKSSYKGDKKGWTKYNRFEIIDI